MYWFFILYVVFPVGLLLLLLLTCPPGRNHSEFVHGIVGRVIFSKYGLPHPLIVWLLAILLLTFIGCLYSVSVSSERLEGESGNATLDMHLLHQSHYFRNQRNLYLTSLALVTWWAVYGIHKLSEATSQQQQQRSDTKKDK